MVEGIKREKPLKIIIGKSDIMTFFLRIFIRDTSATMAPLEVPMRKVPMRKVPMRKVPMRKVPMRKVPMRKVPMRKVRMRKVPMRKVLKLKNTA